jgi:hypothetical protein
MMRHRAPLRLVLAVLCAGTLLACLLAAAAPADTTVPITKLIENMKEYDGKTVTIQGEAIGDVMVRGTNAWITVNDDRYSKKSIEEGGELIGMSNAGIGVWLPASKAELLKICGGYKSKGTIVNVTGVFNRACHEHGGDTDIHATALEVIKDGYEFEHPFSWGKLLALLILVGAAAGLWMWKRQREKAGLREAHRES